MLRCTNRKAPPILALLLLSSACLPAQAAPKKISPQQYQTHLAALQALVHDCTQTTAACDPAKVGDDERIDATPAFEARWQWLRDALTQSHTKPELRANLMQQANTRLADMAHETPQPTPALADARRKANAILSTDEFAIVHEQSWLDRLRARIGRWLGLFFGGLGVLGAAGPWLGRLIEILIFGAALTALIVFISKSLQRQRLAVEFNARTADLAWKRDSTDWAADAETSARDGNWRDAVHCLYWATIVMLEGRRAWRHNPARTPREYVRLLKPNSPQQRALRGLTQIFERLWYGLREAAPADYDRARSLYEDLRDNSSPTEGAA